MDNNYTLRTLIRNTACDNSHSTLVAEMCAGWNLYTPRPPT